MSDLYALDTNVYISALRNRDELALLRRFHIRVGTRLRLAAVVLMELRAGATSPAKQDAVRDLTAAFAARDLVVTPSVGGFAQAGRVLAELRGRGPVSASLANDALLAASCRDAGVVLITANAADFTAIKGHLRGFRVTTPWPAR